MSKHKPTSGVVPTCPCCDVTLTKRVGERKCPGCGKSLDVESWAAGGLKVWWVHVRNGTPIEGVE